MQEVQGGGGMTTIYKDSYGMVKDMAHLCYPIALETHATK